MIITFEIMLTTIKGVGAIMNTLKANINEYKNK
jgi:hypothetical protein